MHTYTIRLRLATLAKNRAEIKARLLKRAHVVGGYALRDLDLSNKYNDWCIAQCLRICKHNIKMLRAECAKGMI